ncbi:MAG: hypothetical protein JWR16_3082 [Nevskia sp.]|nr:hypothetical protein [Nevskia sp.]
MTQGNSKTQRCGVVGLGMIGAGVTKSLLRHGRVVNVFDVRADAAKDLKGAVVCASPAELARQSEVVMVAVVNAEQARSVLAGMAEAAHPDLVVVLLSTVAVPVVHELAAFAQSKGFRLIDCGISGGLHVEQGGGVCMAGGTAETVESVRGVIEQFVTKLLHMGPQGAGMAAKICRNLMHYSTMMGAYEAGQLAEAVGIDVQQLIQAVRTSDPDNQMSTALLARRGTTKPISENEKTFAPVEMIRGWASLLHKDLEAAAELARSVGVKTPGGELANKHGDAIYGVAPQPQTNHLATDPNEDAYTRGLKAMEAVYGVGGVPGLPPPGNLPPFIEKTLEHVFADVWMRPGLSMRDRRLLVLGATAALGRADLVEIQTTGALKTQDLTPAELQESVLQLAYYVGWGNASSTFQGVMAAITKTTAANKPAGQ